MEYQSDSARFVSVMRSLNLRTVLDGESPLLTLNVSALYGNLLAKHLVSGLLTIRTIAKLSRGTGTRAQPQQTGLHNYCQATGIADSYPFGRIANEARPDSWELQCFCHPDPLAPYR